MEIKSFSRSEIVALQVHHGSRTQALGWLNDAAVADGLLRQFGKSHPELARSADFARGFLCGRTSQDVRELAELWTQFSAMKPP